MFLCSALELRVTPLKQRKCHKLRSRPYLFYLLSGINIWYILYVPNFLFEEVTEGYDFTPHVVMAWGASRTMMFILNLIKIRRFVQPLLGEQKRTVKLALHHFLVQKVA